MILVIMVRNSRFSVRLANMVPSVKLIQENFPINKGNESCTLQIVMYFWAPESGFMPDYEQRNQKSIFILIKK